MKIIKKAAGLAVLGVVAIACGKGMSGTYSVSQAMTGGYLSAQCASSQLSLSLSENGNAVNGSGSSSCFTSETLSGTDDGSGHINNVILTVTIATQSQSSYGSNPGYGYGSGTYYGSGTSSPSSTCTYTGTLNFSNNYLSGTLNVQQSSQYSSYSGSCPSSVTLNGPMSG